MVFHVTPPAKNNDFRHEITIDRGGRGGRDTFFISLELLETKCHIPYLIGNTTNTVNTTNTPDNTPDNIGNTNEYLCFENSLKGLKD